MRLARSIVALVALCSAMLTPTPAAAKIPPFSMEVKPASPPVGGEVRVVVRFWNDTARTILGPAWPKFIPGIWAYPLGDGGTVNLHEGVKLVPTQRGQFRMVDSFRPQLGGDWVLIPFGKPSRLRDGRVPRAGPGATQYGWGPPLVFHVGERRAETSPVAPGSRELVTLMIGLAATVAAIGMLGMIRRPERT